MEEVKIQIQISCIQTKPMHQNGKGVFAISDFCIAKNVVEFIHS